MQDELLNRIAALTDSQRHLLIIFFVARHEETADKYLKIFEAQRLVTA